MSIDIRENKPTSTNQIKAEKPGISKVNSVLSGHVAGSMNAGHIKPLTYFEVMPGQVLNELKYYGAFKTLTPKSPVFQNATITFYSVFIPHSAVWKNWEKFIAYKGGTSINKIEEMPNMGGKRIPVSEMYPGDYYTSLTNLACWRDSITSSYIPRITGFYSWENEEDTPGLMPKASILPLRGAIKAWNYIFRDKRYDTEYLEFDGDTVSDLEWNQYMPTDNRLIEKLSFRAKLPDSYLTDYTTNLQGFETEMPESDNVNQNLLKWIEFENKVDFARTSVENEMKNDWDIIAELFDSAPALEGKPQLIGKVTQNLNYAAVTQSAYNTNQNIAEEYQAMGTQGAYSYTNFNGLPLFKNRVFKEAGIIHIFALCSVDTVYTSAFDRMDLNVNIMDKYRPDLATVKTDVQYQLESGTNWATIETNEAQLTMPIWGFKRKFNEIFKIRNTIQGDMDGTPYAQYMPNETENLAIADYDELLEGRGLILTNDTFTFYENNRFFIDEIKYELTEADYGVERIRKMAWKDYSDYTFNRNLAIPQDVIKYQSSIVDTAHDYVLNGQNQIFHGGIIVLNTMLPIENGEEIKNNYTKWGEH